MSSFAAATPACMPANHSEIDRLIAWRNRLDRELPGLRGRDLQCWCPANSRWCHVDILLEEVNR